MYVCFIHFSTTTVLNVWLICGLYCIVNDYQLDIACSPMGRFGFEVFSYIPKLSQGSTKCDVTRSCMVQFGFEGKYRELLSFWHNKISCVKEPTKSPRKSNTVKAGML